MAAASWMQGAAFFADPYATYAELRADGKPVFDGGTNAWLVTRYADVEAVLRDPRISKKIQRASPTVFETSVLFRDPPEHGRIRGLLNTAFASLPDGLEGQVRRIADELIDRMQTGSEADFIRDFALPLPVAVIAQVLGVPPADTEKLHAWSSEFILDEDIAVDNKQKRQGAAIAAMDTYFRELIERGPAEGMIASLMRAQGNDGLLSEDELVGNCILLLVAGHETTVNLLGNGLALLLAEPKRMTRMREEPRLMNSAIDEMLRFESPVQLGTFRVSTEAVEIGGLKIAAGEMISAVVGAANRDPEVFPEPDRFDMERSPNRHLGFGFGPHRCVGAQLARTEARVGFGRLLERLPELRLKSSGGTWWQQTLRRVGVASGPRARSLQWRPTALTRGLKELPIAF